MRAGGSLLVVAALWATACRGQSAPSAAASPGETIALGGIVSNAIANATPSACTRTARDIQGADGTSWLLRCPACAADVGRLWGTDVYTDDSSVCAAAVHAGTITRAGGVVLVTMTSGQPTYAASERNGIRSVDYGAWGRSFFVQAVAADGRPTTAAATLPPAGTVRASCTTRGDMIPDATRVVCPAGCATGRLWGTDDYTSDSAVCLAAVHSGLATVERGGEVRLARLGKLEAYLGTTRNGVVSSDFGSWDLSFTLAR
jgi:hypothetical protein